MKIFRKLFILKIKKITTNFFNYMEIIVIILVSAVLGLYISNGILDIEMEKLAKKKEF